MARQLACDARRIGLTATHDDHMARHLHQFGAEPVAINAFDGPAILRYVPVFWLRFPTESATAT